MKELLQALFSERLRASTRSLSLGVVYQDSETHEQATGVYEFLLRELDDSACVTATWWRTSLLVDPKLSNAAARAVGSSHLVLVSVQDRTDPSPLVQRWIESWPIDITQPPGLIALLYGRTDQFNSSWESYLKRVARGCGMPYLSGSLASITHSPVDPRPVELVSSDRIVEPYLHWGLNE